MKINELISLFYQATGFTIKRTHGGYKFEVTTDLVTAPISLADIKRRVKAYCELKASIYEAKAAYCEDTDGATWFSDCADNWRRTLERV
ncbi:hypothetical protein RASY3_14415 [Ruminococcus albus SY3]|uniref:Uncharacterized protein n=1 Tax=Ruminococcus albus SY3 TaxID=1341156 RepID=A0A011VTH2_RUMAL|nr:hypothetical protein [Ruminococcus albus]EXM38521.1 hypothetical protein RASY3_14415 [Ruminococcus albus SY3]